MGRKKKNIETVVETVSTVTTPTVQTQAQLDPHQAYTKLVRHKPREFSEQYDRLVANGWTLVEVHGNVYLFQRG